MQSQAKALADPSRFRLFQFIADARRPVGVAELTELLGFNHNAIRQHLAILVEAGLVDESNEKRTTRGRPRKQYGLRSDALSAFRSVSGSYERLADLLLELVASGDTPYDVGFRAGAAATGSKAGEQSLERATDLLLQDLSTSGFEPERKKSGVIKLQHCPFADVASKDPSVVCELHRGLINGQLSATGVGLTASLDIRSPKRAGCLVGIAEGSGAGE